MGTHYESILQLCMFQAPKEYVHRVGRTARLGQLGQALLFLLPSETPFVDVLSRAGISRLYLGCILGISRVYLGCISGISRVYLGDPMSTSAPPPSDLCHVAAGMALAPLPFASLQRALCPAGRSHDMCAHCPLLARDVLQVNVLIMRSLPYGMSSKFTSL